jgi:hypothetical protein
VTPLENHALLQREDPILLLDLNGSRAMVRVRVRVRVTVSVRVGLRVRVNITVNITVRAPVWVRGCDHRR